MSFEGTAKNTPSAESRKLCPFMSRPEGDRMCEGRKCMAWGMWWEDGKEGYHNPEEAIMGCVLLKDKKYKHLLI